MLTKYKMPVGIDDFKELRQGNYYFVDKTPFIQDLIDSHSKVTLVTRPRRFGKTLTLSMLRYFFTLEEAEENRKLFVACHIATNVEHMKHQGSLPVVMFSLKDVKAESYDSMLAQLQSVMSTLYRSYMYLLQSDALIGAEKKTFERIVSGCADAVELQRSLVGLTHYLESHYGKTVLLLIDEYDAPIQSAWENDCYDKVINFMRGFLSAALKSNASLNFAVMTGVVRIAKESIFSALNNFEVSTIVDGRYPAAMGFTRQEVLTMAKELGQEDKFDEVCDWYDGYNFSGIDIYNPWSVICYFQRGCLAQPYWINTSGNSILATLMRYRRAEDDEALLSLLAGDSVLVPIDESVIYPDIENNKDALYTIMLEAGYLKTATRELVEGEFICNLAIPNREIRTVYRKEVLNRFRGDMQPSDLLKVLTYMTTGNAKAFAEGLERYLQQMVSFHDTAKRPENFYHGFMLGLSAWLMPNWQVKSNGESGYGRFDIAIYPCKQGHRGICLEFKAANSIEELDRMAEKALLQIEEMNYFAEFHARGITDVWCYGIAFYGKYLKLVCKK